MATKKFLRDEIDKLHRGRRRVITDKIKEYNETNNDKAWAKAIEDPKVRAYLDMIKEAYERINELPEEFVNQAGVQNRISMAGGYGFYTNYSDTEKQIKLHYTYDLPACDEVVELRKELNSVDSEFAKLHQIIDVNTAIKAEKLFKEMGLDLGEELTTSVAVINVDMNLIKGENNDNN